MPTAKSLGRAEAQLTLNGKVAILNVTFLLQDLVGARAGTAQVTTHTLANTFKKKSFISHRGQFPHSMAISFSLG